MKQQITVTLNGRPLSADGGMTLSEIIRGEKPCGGHGRCGKCRVIAKGALSALTEAESALLSADEISNGVRLSCLTKALGDCEVTSLSDVERTQILTDGALPEAAEKPMFSGLGVAMDIGTTTLVAKLYDTNGKMLAEASRLNPQQSFGADVISRIEAALSGKADLLSNVICQALDGMLLELAEKASVETSLIDGVVITGNTVMLSLLVGESVEPFSHAPFEAKRLFGETVAARTLQLSHLASDTPVYLPPCISAFVGADLVCALLASRLCERETAMLADVGTNGEMALWHNESLTVCSTAAGPAFEGVGISMGMRGAEGAVDRVVLSDNGAICAHVIGEGHPKGICGSGLVDAVAAMLQAEVLDETGYLEEEPFVIQAPVSVTQNDIRAFQLAKSAICAGLVTLMESEGLKDRDISALFIAGGFGNYLNKESAAKVGLLPRTLADRSRPIGNAALAGAASMLLNTDMQLTAQELAQRASTIDLASSSVFSERFMSGMMLEEI